MPVRIPQRCNLILCCVQFASIAWFFCFSGTLLADDLRQPTGKVLLTLNGEIEKRNTADGAEFDLSMLEQYGLIKKHIETPWTDPQSVFEGVLIKDILEHVGAKGEWVRATAANNYNVNLPLSDLTDFDILLGISQNGERMQLRDKGPLWILYPNDSRPDVSDTEIHSRMIWQLTSLYIY